MADSPDGRPNGEFDALAQFLQEARGVDIAVYKRESLLRRIRKRLDAVEVDSIRDYIDYLEVRPAEFAHLFNAILIGVSGFFRDPEAWDRLAQTAIPQILQAKGPEDVIRVWSAGCARGQEAYSCAMLLGEALGADGPPARIKIYATDIDESALNAGRLARFRGEDVEPIPKALRGKYLAMDADQFVFRPDIRRAVVFGRHDLAHDAPISRLDLMICRNTLMYFNAETQRHVVERIHYALNNAGFLFLGKAELLVAHAELFDRVDMRSRIFAKAAAARRRGPRGALPFTVARDPGNGSPIPGDELASVAFEHSPHAELVVDADGRLRAANQPARALFEIKPRNLGTMFHDLAVSYRPIELRSMIEQVLTHRRPVPPAEVTFEHPSHGDQHFRVHARPLRDRAGQLVGTAITFEDIRPLRELQAQVRESQEQARQAQGDLQSTNEELETTNEELQSTVEELETTNEELQSTNEELETMNEELQSTNEELQTMNDELNERTDEISGLNVFFSSILANLGAGVVVMDASLNVLTWNAAAEDLWGVRAEEACGRPFPELDFGLDVKGLEPDLRTALTGSRQERTVHAVDRRGRDFICRISCSRMGGSTDRAVIMMMEPEPNA